MRFIELRDGNYINADSVEEVTFEYEGPRIKGEIKSALLTDRKGKTLGYAARPCGLSDLLDWARPVVPALPGTFVLEPYWWEGALGVTRIPVVAWRIGDTCAKPVTATDENEWQDVLHPCGTIVSPFLKVYDSYAEWVEEKTEKLREPPEDKSTPVDSTTTKE